MDGNVPLLTKIRCHYCSKERDPRECVRLTGGVVFCAYCFEWHEKALRMLGGEPPDGCQGCGLSMQKLFGVYGENVRMVAVPKDGIYQILCGACADGYVPLRRDLVKGTAAGEKLR